ncbi:MAG: type IV pilus modification PilV family protein [Candidatus Binataceae bacterium]
MKDTNRLRKQAGFTLVETLIALVILAVGVIGLEGMLATGLTYMTTAKDDYIAQQKAAETIESIFTARDMQQASWANINNTGAGGIFVSGASQLCDPGLDQIDGTIDDDCTKPQYVRYPGPDGIMGTADDVLIPLSNFTRTILIQDVPGFPGLRQITVTIDYTSGRFTRQYVFTTNISEYS